MEWLGDSVTDWFSCSYNPVEPGWYEVRRFTDEGEPFIPECTRLYWDEYWYYDEDYDTFAIMNPDNGDCWRARTYTVM
jgi:hypothetical protein